MLDELGIELIYANTAEAKGKIEKMNNTIQNRLLNDIQRFKINSYDELNRWFNDYYINYINHKFAYVPKEEESEFIPIGNTDLRTIMCIKAKRTILNRNMISINNTYKIFKNGKIYSTRKIEGHRIDPVKRKQKRIQDQKDLERVLRERDERLKARANEASSS